MKFKADTELPQSNSNSLFLKLKDGEYAKGIFAGEPVDFMKAFKEGEEPAFRFMINFIVLENGVYTAKIFEQGAKTYKDLRKLAETGYDLDKTMMIISRTGTEKKTQYTVMPAPNAALTPEDLGVIARVKLQELKPKN